jgi:uncharacterized protein (TIGR02722 family)
MRMRVCMGKMKQFFPFLPVMLLGFVGCTPAFEGEYADPNTTEIIDDRWNDADARKTSEILIRSMLEKPWINEFKGKHNGTKPVVIVADIANRTDEHIETKAIGEGIRDELINSGKIRFVDGDRRKQILEEMRYQNESGMVSTQSAKKKGNQTGADFMLSGTLTSIVNEEKGRKNVVYQTILQLTDLETTEMVWSQKYQIKKKFKRSGAGW